MRTVLVTAPAAEPVTLDEAKAHLRVTIDDDDDRITRQIAVAREQAETIARLAIVTQTWDLYLDRFPDTAGYWDRRNRQLGPGSPAYWPRRSLGKVQIPRPPLVSIGTVEYVDASGSTVTLDSAEYRVGTGTPGTIAPALNRNWPTAADVTDAVRIRFTAGYGNASAVPACVKEAILLLVERLYDGTPDGEPPEYVKRVLGPVLWGSYR